MQELSEPIVIMGQPRCGSSMTAGLFARHGVWTGTCRPGDASNPKGHFENIPLRTMLIGAHKNVVQKGVLAAKISGFREQALQAIRNDGYTQGPWLFKGSAIYWPAFFEFKPRFVVVDRPREQIFKSCRKTGMLGNCRSDVELYANIDFHQQQMDYLVTFKQAVRVNTFEVVQGDFTSIKHALYVCGIEPLDDKIRDFVDDKLWHYKQ